MIRIRNVDLLLAGFRPDVVIRPNRTGVDAYRAVLEGSWSEWATGDDSSNLIRPSIHTAYPAPNVIEIEAPAGAASEADLRAARAVAMDRVKSAGVQVNGAVEYRLVLARDVDDRLWVEWQEQFDLKA